MPPECAWCGERIEGAPVDEHGTVYRRLCFDLWRALLWPELAREGGSRSSPARSSVARRRMPPIRHLWIVARPETDLFVYLSQRFAGRPHVELILDRRHGERRQRAASPTIERRQADRRQHPVEADLARLGVTIVQTDD